MSEGLYEPQDVKSSSAKQIDEALSRKESSLDKQSKMIKQVMEWTEGQIELQKELYAKKFGEQLPLLPVVDNVDMNVVRTWIMKINALDEVIGQLNEYKVKYFEDMAGHGLPIKTIRSAIKIAGATHKRDSTREILNACVAVVLSLMEEEQFDMEIDKEIKKSQERPIRVR